LRKGIIRVLSLEIDNQLGELMILTVHVDRIFKSLPSDDGGEVPKLFAVNSCLNAALQINSPALIEPKVFP